MGFEQVPHLFAEQPPASDRDLGAVDHLGRDGGPLRRDLGLLASFLGTAGGWESPLD
jgi:hypothetical protein